MPVQGFVYPQGVSVDLAFQMWGSFVHTAHSKNLQEGIVHVSVNITFKRVAFAFAI